MAHNTKNAFLAALKSEEVGVARRKFLPRHVVANKRSSPRPIEESLATKRLNFLIHGSVESITNSSDEEDSWDGRDVEENVMDDQVFKPISMWPTSSYHDLYNMKEFSGTISSGHERNTIRKTTTFPNFRSSSSAKYESSARSSPPGALELQLNVDMNNNEENIKELKRINVENEKRKRPCLKKEASVCSENNSCDIYCFGPVLEAAQKAYIYNDSKSFVDMKMKKDSAVILEDFESLQNATGGQPSDAEVKEFVDDHFLPPGSEFENWTPEDWTETPAFLETISDPNLKSWASDLNVLWKDLGRKIISDVGSNNSRYSIIYSPNPFIIPGGRFREFYYWDTYWVIRGLLLSEMYTTVKGTIRNFLDMVKQYGFVPNGGRLYYTRRSQPPFLTLMVKEYVDKTGDQNFLEEALPVLEEEYNFWMTNRSVVVQDANNNSFTMNRYGSEVNQPRPESYREDSELIKDLPEVQSLELMSHITSACESGWDFSSRWTGSCYKNTSRQLLLDLRTRDIVPVDLNSIMASVERTLAEFHETLGNQEKSSEFQATYDRRVEAIESVLWNEEDGTYYDYLIVEKIHNRQFFASNLNPLWTKCYGTNVDVAERERRMYEYMKKLPVLNFPGGIPTSLNDSGQQWDFPNAWPPLVHMIIEGMATSSISEIQDEASIQAQKWISSNWKAYNGTQAMFEKYDVTRADGLPGGGGEYDVQTGFGWTNGVVMSLLDMYGDKLTAEPINQPSTVISSSTPSGDAKTTTSGTEQHLAGIGALVLGVTIAQLSPQLA